MHWGDNLDRGSEHLIDNHAYSAEVIQYKFFFSKKDDLHQFLYFSYISLTGIMSSIKIN